jgi:hypothetical protein
MAMKWMNNIGMDEYLFKTTTEVKDYNRINTNVGNGDGDVDVDDAQASKNSDGGEDRCPSASSPSRPLSEVRFL